MFRSSLETSNIGRAAGVCCLAVVCRVAGIGACEKEHPGRAKGTIKTRALKCKTLGGIHMQSTAAMHIH